MKLVERTAWIDLTALGTVVVSHHKTSECPFVAFGEICGEFNPIHYRFRIYLQF